MHHWFEVFRSFLWLGLTSFGGPIAHLAYFRNEFVERRGWLSDQHFADLVALCQFLPGPASSQMGFALGLQRAGWRGGLAAWVAFTLPSAVFLLAAAWIGLTFQEGWGSDFVASLKLVAVIVVAHAVWGMRQQLCHEPATATLGLLAVLLMLGTSPWLGPLTPLVTLLIGGGLGWLLFRTPHQATPPSTPPLISIQPWVAWFTLGLFLLLLVLLPLLSQGEPSLLQIFDRFYRAGALVFGGGHVVLPLLEAETVRSSWISSEAFLAGYGLAQAVPGPLFTFAAYLGAFIPTGWPLWVGALVALVALFLPGLLILVALLPYWARLQADQNAQAILRGVNASVVGLLGAVLYDPLFTSSVHQPYDLMVVLLGLVLLQVWRWPSWAMLLLILPLGMLAQL